MIQLNPDRSAASSIQQLVDPLPGDRERAAEDAAQGPVARRRRRSSPWTWRLVAPLLIVVGLVIYFVGLTAPFLFDDFHAVANSELVKNPTFGVFRGSRPLGTLSFAANRLWAGETTWRYRIVNIAIHVVSAGLLYGVTWRTLLSSVTPAWLRRNARGIAAAAALLWMVHPLQTNAVTYIVQRYESQMTLFFLLSFYGLVRAARSSQPAVWCSVSVAACWLGMGTKEVMAACPLLLLLFDRIYLTESWSVVFRRRGLVHAATFAAWSWLAFQVAPSFVPGAGSATVGFGYEHVTPWEYLRSQPGVLLHYLRLVFWPDHLVLDYGWLLARTPLEIYGKGAVILGLFGATLVALWRKPTLGFVGLACFAILAPTSSFVPIQDLAFEHRMYLPLAGVVLLVVVGVAAIIARLPLDDAKRPLVAIALVGVAAMPLGWRTMARNRDFRDPGRIWRSDIAFSPHNARAYFSLGGHLAKIGKDDEAVDAYRTSIRLYPSYAKPYFNLANLYARRKDYDRAVKYYELAVSRDPGFVEAYVRVSKIKAQQNDAAGAVQICREGLEKVPNNDVLSKRLAWILATSAEPAVQDPREALRICDAHAPDPERSPLEWLDVRAAALARKGDFAQAQKLTRAALRKANPAESASLAERLDCYLRNEPYVFQQQTDSPPAADDEDR